MKRETSMCDNFVCTFTRSINPIGHYGVSRKSALKFDSYLIALNFLNPITALKHAIIAIIGPNGSGITRNPA